MPWSLSGRMQYEETNKQKRNHVRWRLDYVYMACVSVLLLFPFVTFLTATNNIIWSPSF
jgi:hypothetical protein